MFLGLCLQRYGKTRITTGKLFARKRKLQKLSRVWSVSLKKRKLNMSGKCFQGRNCLTFVKRKSSWMRILCCQLERDFEESRDACFAVISFFSKCLNWQFRHCASRKFDISRPSSWKFLAKWIFAWRLLVTTQPTLRIEVDR